MSAIISAIVIGLVDMFDYPQMLISFEEKQATPNQGVYQIGEV